MGNVQPAKEAHKAILDRAQRVHGLPFTTEGKLLGGYIVDTKANADPKDNERVVILKTYDSRLLDQERYRPIL